jgi:nucleoside-diphosphate-sugar epimerase
MKDWLWFVSGVSNSGEMRASEYQREVSLLLRQDTSLHIVYVSSLCVFYSDTPYARHKRMMEKLIKQTFKRHTIIRIGNITWGDNPHTLLNFLRKKIRNKEPFEIRDVYRYIVDKDEFLYWLRLVPEWNCEMNIPGKRMKVCEVVEMLRAEM